MRSFVICIGAILPSLVFASPEATATKKVVSVPPISCATALRNFDSLKLDRELQRPLDTQNARILAEAGVQLSTGTDLDLSYEKYLQPVLDWTEPLSKELKRVADIQEFLRLHRRRFLELLRHYDSPSTPFDKIIYFKRIGSIDRENRTAKRVDYYTRPHLTFKNRAAIKREMDKVVAEMALVRDEFLPEALTSVGVYRWMLHKLYNYASTEDRTEARTRVSNFRKEGSERARLEVLVKEARDKNSARYLLDIFYLLLEDEDLFIKKEDGKPDVEFMKSLDATMGSRLNEYYDSLLFQARLLAGSAKKTAFKGYESVTKVHKFWGMVRNVLGIGVIYTGILGLGSDAIDKTKSAWHWMTTPDRILQYEAMRAREQQRKVEIADKTIVGLAEADNPEDAVKSFAEVYANYIREKAGDRAALLYSRFVLHWVETGKAEWQPETEDDKKLIAQVTDLIAMSNVQLFNEGPFPSADGKPQRFLSSAVIDRWPWRTETEGNLEKIMDAVQTKKVKGPFPLPEGVLPPSYMPQPEPSTEWKLIIAGEKLGRWVGSSGTYWFWDLEPIRYAWMVALGFGGVHYGRKYFHRRRQTRFEDIEIPVEEPAPQQ